MKRGLWLIFLCVFMVLIGCSKQNLSEKKEEFSGKGRSYSFQLPKNWTFQEQYRDRYNESAVFGAQDEKSKSDMFIRIVEKDESDIEKFKAKKKKELLQTYELEDMYVETFEANDWPVAAYTFNSHFDKQKVFVHKFYVLAKHQVLEFTFYSATNGNYEKRAEIFEESVKSVKEENDTMDTTEISSVEQKRQEVENERVSFVLSGYKTVISSEGKRLLIVRYVFKNKTDEEIAPNIWNSLVTATQHDKALALSSVTEDESTSDLNYLLEISRNPLKKGETIESAVVYELTDMPELDVSLVFNQNEFEGKDPMVISVKKE